MSTYTSWVLSSENQFREIYIHLPKNDEVYAARKFSEHTKQGDVEKAPPLKYNFGCPC